MLRALTCANLHRNRASALPLLRARRRPEARAAQTDGRTDGLRSSALIVVCVFVAAVVGNRVNRAHCLSVAESAQVRLGSAQRETSAFRRRRRKNQANKRALASAEIINHNN